jgi:hypothetical protein
MYGNEMMLTTEGLKIGDWVLMVERSRVYKGYVTHIHSFSSMSVFCLGFYEGFKYSECNKDFHKISTSSMKYNIYKAPSITIEDLEDKTHIIDLALQTGDENWFRELVG